jgi:hypothetical protein
MEEIRDARDHRARANEVLDRMMAEGTSVPDNGKDDGRKGNVGGEGGL